MPHGDERCDTCRFHSARNECRRFPPAIRDRKYRDGEWDTDAMFPWVDGDWWCGEFQIADAAKEE